MTDTTVLLSFCYASYCLCQFIIVEGGFLPSHPLTAHLFIVLSMVNFPSHKVIAAFISDREGPKICKGDGTLSLNSMS